MNFRVLNYYVRKLFSFTFIVFLCNSCFINSTITDIPLIEEKGQTKVSYGLTCPVPGLFYSYSKGFTSKIAIQSSVHASLFSLHLQQSIGLYKKGKQSISEIYVGGLYGFGIAGSTFLGGDFYMRGKYSILYLQYNQGFKFKKYPRTVLGYSLKPGMLYSKYYYHNQQSGGNETVKMPYVSPIFFVKFNLVRWDFGIYTEVPFGYKNSLYRVGIYSMGITLKKNLNYTKSDVIEFKSKQEKKYTFSNVISLSFNSPSYIWLSEGDNEYQNNIKANYTFYPLGIELEHQFNYWFSLGITASYYKIKGSAYIRENQKDWYKTTYTQQDFAIKVCPRIHYYISDKFNAYIAVRYSDSHPIVNEVVIKSQNLKTNSLISIPTTHYEFIPVGLRYFIYKNIGLHFEYSLVGKYQALELCNFMFGLQYKY